MKKSLNTFVLIVFVFQCCICQQKIETYKIPSILAGKKQAALIVDYSSNIELIPLETRNDCLVDYVLQVLSDSVHIYVWDRSNKVFIFNQKGKFIGKIVPKGKGPGEYRIISQRIMLFSEQGIICIYDASLRKLLMFNNEGEFLKEVKLDFPVQALERLGNNTIVCLTDALYTKTSLHELNYFDISRMCFVKKLALQAQTQFPRAPMYRNPGFSIAGNELILRLPFCETIFRIDQESCQPAFILKLGPKGMTRDLYTNLSRLEAQRSDFIDASLPFITRQYIFLELLNFGRNEFAILNKNTNKWIVSEMPENIFGGLFWDSKKKLVMTMNNCQNEVYYSVIEAQDFLEDFSKIYPKLCSQIKVDDNPIILQASLN